jgi:hypothetical protein
MFSYTPEFKFTTGSLPDELLTDELAIIESETNTTLGKYIANVYDQFVIVSSMNFTALRIAAELATQHESSTTPLVIFIDNSQLAAQFWNQFCDFFIAVKEKDIPFFPSELEKFFKQHTDYICPALFTDEQKEIFMRYTFNYVNRIFEQYDFKFLRNIVQQVIYIKQNWRSARTFSNLKNYFLKNEFKFTFVYADRELTPTDQHDAFKSLLEAKKKRKRRLDDEGKNESDDTEEKGEHRVRFASRP